MSNSIKNLPLINGANNIEKAIAEWKTQARSIQAKLHRLACSTLAHYFEHGDSTLCSKLIEAMPKGQRVNKLTLWFCNNGGMECLESKGRFIFKKRMAFDVLTKELRIQQAVAEPFWIMKAKADEDKAFNYADYENQAANILATILKSGNVIDFQALKEKAMKRAKIAYFPNTGVQYYIEHGKARQEAPALSNVM